MKIAYFDCFSGIAGDMCLGALLHAGLPREQLEAELAKLGLDEFKLEVQRTWRDAMEGMRVDVVLDPAREPPHRRLADVRNILAGSALDPAAKDQANQVFTRLAAAEAQVHGTTPDEVHFHEVGAVDAIVDIVGTVVGLKLLGVEQVYASRIAFGRGFTKCEHGVMPVPVPASVILLEGAPVFFSDLDGELVTPTGAALIATLATRIGATFSMVPSAVGYGFGKRERKDGPPNALRLILGEAETGYEEVVVIETNLDDTTGQVVGYLIERALEAGALDAWASPVQMKKSRPGMLFAALVEESRADVIERLVFAETATLGVRRHRVQRAKLERRQARVLTSLGEVNVKFARGPLGLRRAAPEYDDVARIATERGVPFRQALETIQREIPAWPAEGA